MLKKSSVVILVMLIFTMLMFASCKEVSNISEVSYFNAQNASEIAEDSITESVLTDSSQDISVQDISAENSLAVVSENIEESIIDVPDDYTVEYKDSTIVICNNMFAGGYQNGIWRKDDYTFGELLSYPKYYLWDQNGLIGEKDELTFAYGDYSLPDYNKVLDEYVSDNSCRRISFKLPVKVKGAAATIKIGTYNSDVYYNNEYVPLITNATHNLAPRKVTKIEQITKQMKNAVKKVLDEKSFTEMDVYINSVYETDIEGNGEKSYIILAKYGTGDVIEPTPEEVDGHHGSYDLCLILKGDKVNLVYGLFSPFEEHDIESLSISHFTQIMRINFFDIDNNGVYEIIIDQAYWESGANKVFALQNGKWVNVLQADGGY